MRRPRWVRLLAVLAVAVFFGAACDSDDGESDQATEQATEQEADGPAAVSTDTGAAQLRADLTALLQEHVYLAGIAISTGVAAGLDSPEFGAAAGALGENSQALADAVGSVYGEDKGETFLGLWETHIGFFVDYTKAVAGDDPAGKAKAVADLGQYVKDFGAFLEGVNPNLPADAVADALAPHAESLFAAIDAVVAGDGTAFTKLREAAGHMPMIAATLAGGIVKQSPEKFA